MVRSLKLAHKQKGMTLLVALVTLIVLMLLGISAMNASNTMLKLAGNLQYENEAKNRAESALITAEGWLMSGANASNAGFTTSTGYLFNQAASVDPLSSWPSGASSVGANEAFIIQRITATPVTPPGEQVDEDGNKTTIKSAYHLYRVTARGQSARGAQRYVESIVQIKQ
jgi:Tfp pilus assembly protein PilX